LSRPVRLLVVLAAAASLGGCVSLFPKAKPSQLYDFSDAPVAPPSASSRAPSAVMLGAVIFPRAATSDAILTRTGAEAAYIAGARWVAPAQVLFREAVDRAFDSGGKVRVLARGELGQAAGVVRIEVRTFETRYPAPEAVPTVTVALQARLTRMDGSPVDEREFKADTLASDNRVGAIVDAYRASTGKALGDLVAWVEATAPPPAAAAGGRTTTTTTQSTTTSTTTTRP
jgi:cholesterol transport system auxiliary component